MHSLSYLYAYVSLSNSLTMKVSLVLVCPVNESMLK